MQPLHQTAGARLMLAWPNVDTAGLVEYLKSKGGDELTFGQQFMAVLATQNPAAITAFILANLQGQFAFFTGLAQFIKAAPASGGTSGPAPFPGSQPNG